MFLHRLISGLMLLLMVIMIPYMITTSMTEVQEGVEEELNQRRVIVKESNGEKTEMDIETYIIGVVAAEMPVSFQEEALKAQAVAARTYTIKQFGEEKVMEAEALNQSYLAQDQMEEVWGVQLFVDNYNKIMNAVRATEGEIIEYEEEPIEAVFHSTSAGRTQSASDVWETDIPYLASVDSQEDIQSPNYLQIVEMTNEEVILAIKENVADFQIYTDNLLEVTQIIGRSAGGYVQSIQIGNKIFSGEELREYLKLSSSNFTIEAFEDNIRFICKGYGHGVGLSQYGANYMAIKGATYKEIIKHYYTGTEIVKMEEIE